MAKDSEYAFAMTLEGELAKMFLAIKGYYCLENNTEVIRTLIREKYERLFPKKIREA